MRLMGPIRLSFPATTKSGIWIWKRIRPPPLSDTQMKSSLVDLRLNFTTLHDANRSVFCCSLRRATLWICGSISQRCTTQRTTENTSICVYLPPERKTASEAASINGYLSVLSSCYIERVFNVRGNIKTVVKAGYKRKKALSD